MDYRKRALKIHPWVCARCAREFTGRNLRQLTVHHKDHDHTNNPADGSNWELLCIYCHDDEHSRNETAQGIRQAEDRPAVRAFDLQAVRPSRGSAQAGRIEGRSSFAPSWDVSFDLARFVMMTR